MPALFGRSLLTKLFGIKRRSRALRHALETRVVESVRAAEQASRPEDAAHHSGAQAAYLKALTGIARAPAVAVPGPPSDPRLRAAWERGFRSATRHAERLIDELV